METNIIWQGIEYTSLENCLVVVDDQMNTIQSTVVGLYHGLQYLVNYQIVTDRGWNTRSVEVVYRHSDEQRKLSLQRDTAGSWRLDGKLHPAFEGCTDVDIAITPFTNTLPVNRLMLQADQSAEISVVYLDVLAFGISKVRQRYIRKSANVYHYENIPNDFEADITVDDDGIVVGYPSLFNRLSSITSHYGAQN